MYGIYMETVKDDESIITEIVKKFNTKTEAITEVERIKLLIKENLNHLMEDDDEVKDIKEIRVSVVTIN